jgi:pyruvate/2-oxoacid:ferredoxin oxidoreductase alpha subunit
MLRMETLAPQVYGEWERLTGRSYDIVETYRMEDARIALVTSGTVSQTAREVVDSEWARGQRVGLVQMKMFRPFPIDRVREVLGGVEKIAVIDRNCSYGHHGIWFQEIKSALYAQPEARRPRTYGYVMGLGGRDIGVDAIEDVLRRTVARDRPDPETLWLGAVLPSRTAPRPEAVR